MQSEEGSSKAGREGGLRLGDSSLSARNLGGVSRQEVVHGLLRRQDGHRGQHAEGIAGEKEDSCGVVAEGVLLVAGDVVDGVRDTTVLSLGHTEIEGQEQVSKPSSTAQHSRAGRHSLEEVHLLGGGVEGHILKQGVALDGSEDLRLGLLGEVDGLGVAALRTRQFPRQTDTDILTPSKLKMPWSSHPCSSSPIRARLRSTH